MGIKSVLIKPVASLLSGRINNWSSNAVACQERILTDNVKYAANTKFGKDHEFGEINSYDDFRKKVPIRDYEALKPYFEEIKEGKKDILWPGKPLYLAKTSGTTSGVKYIPLTKESLPNHFGSARNALFHYINQTGKGDFIDGKMIFLSGSPDLDKVNGIHIGRLSGIVNHQVPSWLRTNQLPSFKTNCMEDWEAKLDKIVEETINQDMRLISGIPPWVQMYYERLLAVSGKKCVKDVFPNLSMFVYGGVSFEPYRHALEALVGQRIPSVETYPASEGFIAFQDKQGDPGLLLNVNSGIFFEFVPVDEIFSPNPSRYALSEVRKRVNYALIINNNAGLWGYNIGDTVEFVSLNPYKIQVTGRVKHFISAFGEHVIGKEVEAAMLAVSTSHGAGIFEFTVAPEVNPPSGEKPYHEWFIEFDRLPGDLNKFACALNEEMVKQNIYYADLIHGKILQPLKIKPLEKGAFIAYMRNQGKLGGQNKVPRLTNDRKIADELSDYELSAVR